MTSKFFLSLTCLLLTVSACALETQPNYTVTFPVGVEFDNTMAYVEDWDSGMRIDSAVVVDGVVNLRGHIVKPGIGRIIVNGSRGPLFFMESGNVTIDSVGHLSGTTLNDKYSGYIAQMDSLVAAFNRLDRNDSIQMVKARSIYEEYNNLPSKIYSGNKDNVLGLYFYMQKAFEKPLAELESDMAANPVLASSKQVLALQNTLCIQSETAEGKHYKDFSVEYDGKVQKLSDYVKPGRYTLVDFWASWCGPCVKQLSVLKELYGKYKDKGLDVIGVAVWDEPDATAEAIKKHALPWQCIINAQTVPTDLYGIQGIPCILLINPDGIIVSRDKQGADLINDVDEAMASFMESASADVKSSSISTDVKVDTVAAF